LTARVASPSHAVLIASWTTAPKRANTAFYRCQAYLAPKFRIDQGPRDDIRVRDRIFWEEPETESACDHGQFAITIAAINGLTVDTAGIEHSVIHHVIELTARLLHITPAGEIRNLDRIARSEGCPAGRTIIICSRNSGK
jgi:hypothetical protein